MLERVELLESQSKMMMNRSQFISDQENITHLIHVRYRTGKWERKKQRCYADLSHLRRCLLFTQFRS